MAVVCLAFLSFLSGPSPVLALDRTKRVQDYVLDQWDARHGLSFTTVRAIRQTPDGYLWLGTQSGLVRFDGDQFTVFDVQNTPGLGHNHLWSLAAARDGSLWIASNRGLSRWHQGEVTRHEENALRSGTLRTLLEGRDGSLWIGAANGGLDRWLPGSPGKHSEQGGLSGDSVHALAEDPQGRIWIGTNRGLDLLTNGRVEHQPIGRDLIWALLAGLDGSVWIGTEGGGLWQWKDGAFRQFTKSDGLPGNEVRALQEDKDGNLWVGTNYGLGRLTDGRWSRLGIEDGLSTNLVRSLHEDADGSLWVGFYGGGLSRLRDGEFTSLSAREGLAHDLTWGIAESPDGSLWVSTHAGVSRRKDGRWTSYTTKEGLVDNITRPLMLDRRGTLWVGTNKGASRFSEGRWSTVTSVPPAVVQSLYEARDGAIWFGTWEGLYRLHEGRVRAFLAPDLNQNEFRSLHEDRQGTLWVGMTRGLARVAGSAVVPFLPNAPWSSVSVEALRGDRDGALWVGTDGAGLFRIEGDTWTQVTARNGLLDDTVFHIVEDGADNLWLGSPRGVSRVSRRSLTEFAAGRIPRITGDIFGVAHGMKSSECTGGGSQPGAFKDRAGRLWFPTNRGVVSIDPNRLGGNPPPPLAHIEQVRFDQALVPTSGEVVAGPGRGDLEVRYSAVNFISPGVVRFRYRLQGFDNSWVEAADRRVAHYANLPPGRYRFVVSATNDGASWSPEGTGLQLDLRPRFRQTTWFRGLVGLGILGLGLGAHRLRVHTLEERERRFRTLAEHERDVVVRFDRGLRLRYISPAAEEHTGQAPASLLGRPLKDLGIPAPSLPAVEEALRNVLKSGHAASHEMELETPGGRRFFEARLVPEVGGDGSRDSVLGIVRDVTERRHAEEERARFDESLRRSQTMASMGALVAGVAHEVRNPLFTISATLDAMEAELAGENPYRSYAEVLRAQVERLNKLTRELLAYGRPPVPELTLSPIEGVIAEALATCQPLARRTGVELASHVTPGLPRVRMERSRLLQVFHNLVENAIQHSPAGSTVSVLADRTQGHGETLECSVVDAGSGFKEEDLPRLFEPFFTRRVGGTGLGLSIVQRIVEDHGGRVTAANRPGGGVILRVLLPIGEAERA